MKILVLGGGGFIGCNLVGKLVSAGHDVRVYGRSLPKLCNQFESVEYLQGSFDDLKSVSKAMRKIEAVYHLISSSIPSTSNLSPEKDIRDNLVNTVNLLECMGEMNIRRILYFSSGGAIYGDTDKTIISEDHPLNPNCSYGIVKLAVEKYLMMYAKLYEFEPVIYRVSNPFGPWQSKIGLQGLIGTILAKVIKKEPVEIWGDGRAVRDYLYIDDLMDACMCALNSNESGIFNVGSGLGYTVNQIIGLVEEVTSSKVEVKYSKPREVDVRRVVLNIDKIKAGLGWEPKVNIKDGMVEHYQWLQTLSMKL